MFVYQLKIALKSLRRNPILTTLLIGGIALGICVSTAFITLRHLYTQDPLPGKSDKVFSVRLDSWGTARPFRGTPDALPDQLTYRDLRGVMKSNIPVRQSGTFKTSLFVHPDPKISRPYNTDVRLVFRDFFDMFDVPFRYGGAWSKAADAKPEQVIVIDDETNRKLFGGEDSVGRTIRLGDRDFKVIGVLARWRPGVRIYDLTQNSTGAPEGMFIPFNFVEPMELRTSGNLDSWKAPAGTTFRDFLNAETIWLQFWVELPSTAARDEYRDWLQGYMLEQRKIGRFARPLRAELTTLPDFMKEQEVLPDGVRAMSVVSVLFLAVCSVNLVGILLGKFLARIPEVSVRRALGASRAQVFWQHIIECELIGVAGGALGLVLAAGLLRVLAKFMANGEALHLDGEMLLTAAFLSLVAGLVAGIYPAWRVCSVPPAMQLKVQ